MQYLSLPTGVCLDHIEHAVHQLGRLPDPEDIILWPCGTWCYREELSGYTYMSDDFEVVPFNTTRYWEIQNG